MCAERRIDRALSQRLYVVKRARVSSTRTNYAIMGSTGNVYDVAICEEKATCTCPDAMRAARCKHVFFVLLCVMQMGRRDPLLRKKSWTEEEMINILDRDEHMIWSAPESICAAYVGNTESMDPFPVPKLYSITESCAVCYEELGEEKQNVTLCAKQCKQRFHRECLEMWFSKSRTCPLCRACWPQPVERKKVHAYGKTYDNFAHLL